MGRIVEKFACCELSSVDIWVRSSSPFGKGGLRGIEGDFIGMAKPNSANLPSPLFAKEGNFSFLGYSCERQTEPRRIITQETTPSQIQVTTFASHHQ